ncbi:hypothetical protein BJP41_10360 (plasmid) [Candidatus Williamhamiltonella defendens]|uniref:Lipoprotein n=1 Tax=Candidatus Williamhamiltonella defendens TaxID=138072 RepID=A0A2D3T7J6_9ENTR|nr:hypothetical protein [Candidatus Hamiltonella defensa]ATW30866.1 hypothetical protein BJP41_10360 [Candidatus Hamiltonella defensa]ATW31758.1 hypothetical protein BJP42_04970 [Candidatus Hamiltonella defensa]ATW32893.1 hypothetical protein BJP42_10950 [Candidatus Hamiltonella defensa]
MRQLIAILGVAILAGCASNTHEQKQQSQVVPAESDKPARVNRELSLAWDNMSRGGAALRQPGYIHVLGDGNVGATMNKAKDRSGAEKKTVGIKEQGDVNEAIKTFKSIRKGKGYSLYELSRWERYCDSGKGMDEHDWRFVEDEGETSIPKDVVTGCIPPTHTYQDYLNAWTHFCSSQAVTDADRRIVRESVRPYSVVNPCKALK